MAYDQKDIELANNLISMLQSWKVNTKKIQKARDAYYNDGHPIPRNWPRGWTHTTLLARLDNFYRTGGLIEKEMTDYMLEHFVGDSFAPKELRDELIQCFKCSKEEATKLLEPYIIITDTKKAP